MSASGQTRRLTSWIAAFELFTEHSNSPELFRRWAAISAIAGALERKVWVVTLGNRLYPNLYVVLIAPPGIGKSVALSYTETFWRELPDHHVAPTSLTKAALIDSLKDATRRIIMPGGNPPYVEFNSLLVPISELGVFLPAYDNDFMNTLTAIYDGYQYAERRRSKDLNITIEAPQLNLLAATTPSYLKAFLPEGAWDQGFLSRTLLVYTGERQVRSLFDIPASSNSLRGDLIHDLRVISEAFGQMGFTDEAKSKITEWHLAGGPPIPDHPRLQHYLTRRTAHVLKLSIIAAIDRGETKTIAVEDFELAKYWLLEMEETIPDIFKSMTSGGDSAVMDECWHFVWQTWSKEKRPVAEARVVAFLRDRAPSHNVIRILEIMVRTQMVKSELTSAGIVYTPAPKNARF